MTSVQCSARCSMFYVQYSVSMHCPESSAMCPVLYALCPVYCVQCSVSSILCLLSSQASSVQSPVSCVHCPESSAMCPVLCPLCSVYCVQCFVSSIICLLSSQASGSSVQCLVSRIPCPLSRVVYDVFRAVLYARGTVSSVTCQKSCAYFLGSSILYMCFMHAFCSVYVAN